MRTISNWNIYFTKHWRFRSSPNICDCHASEFWANIGPHVFVKTVFKSLVVRKSRIKFNGLREKFTALISFVFHFILKSIMQDTYKISVFSCRLYNWQLLKTSFTDELHFEASYRVRKIMRLVTNAIFSRLIVFLIDSESTLAVALYLSCFFHSFGSIQYSLGPKTFQILLKRCSLNFLKALNIFRPLFHTTCAACHFWSWKHALQRPVLDDQILLHVSTSMRQDIIAKSSSKRSNNFFSFICLIIIRLNASERLF